MLPYLIMLVVLMMSNVMLGTDSFTLESSSFTEGQPLPAVHAWKQGNKAPHLSWSNVPKGVQSFALIVDDPDAPTEKPWVHWVIFNIPASHTSISKQFGSSRVVAGGIRQGINTYEEIGYGGPHPPIGEKHRYYFKLYALDKLLPLAAGATKEQVLAAMQGHILGIAQLMGTFERKKES